MKVRCETHKLVKVLAPTIRDPKACIYTCLECPYKIIRPEMIVFSYTRCNWPNCDEKIQITKGMITGRQEKFFCIDHRMVIKINKAKLREMKEQNSAKVVVED